MLTTTEEYDACAMDLEETRELLAEVSAERDQWCALATEAGIILEGLRAAEQGGIALHPDVYAEIVRVTDSLRGALNLRVTRLFPSTKWMDFPEATDPPPGTDGWPPRMIGTMVEAPDGE